jgi:ADP-heptose:LPS heptosyltransferase
MPTRFIDECAANAALLPMFWTSGELLIGVGAGSKMPAKIWPESRFSELGKQLLLSNQNARLIMLGGPEDRDAGDRLCAAWGSERSANLAGRLSIYAAAAVLRRCDLYIGNDTGTMHLAGAVGTPSVAIFSARDFPGLWDPIGNQNVILRKEVACAGCMLEVCTEKKNLCLREITVDEVVQAVSLHPSFLHRTSLSAVKAFL